MPFASQSSISSARPMLRPPLSASVTRSRARPKSCVLEFELAVPQCEAVDHALRRDLEHPAQIGGRDEVQGAAHRPRPDDRAGVERGDHVALRRCRVRGCRAPSRPRRSPAPARRAGAARRPVGGIVCTAAVASSGQPCAIRRIRSRSAMLAGMRPVWRRPTDSATGAVARRSESVRGQDAELGELLAEAGAVGRVHPWRAADLAVLLGLGASTGEHGLTGGQLADGDRGDAVGVLARELAVERLVVLAVVADEQPLEAGELLGQPDEARSLVLAPAAEPAVVRRTPVGQQQGTGREEVAREEAGERRRDVPGAGREVDHGRAGMRRREPLEQHGHARGRHARVLVEHERVPGGEQRAGERGDHHGVVDVGDDAERRRRVDDEDAAIRTTPTNRRWTSGPCASRGRAAPG